MLKGHPKGLLYLCSVTACEKFSFYGIRLLLLFYMIERFGFAETQAYATFAGMVSLSYCMPLFGGWLADRIYGPFPVGLLGGVCVLASALLILFPHLTTFYVALALLALGAGLIRATVPTLVGKLYDRHPELRDAGFTIMHTLVNFGVLAASVVCGVIGETLGWHWGFLLSAISVLVLMTSFALAYMSLRERIKPKIPLHELHWKHVLSKLGMTLAVTMALGGVIRWNDLLFLLFPLALITIFIGLFYITYRSEAAQRPTMYKIIIIMLMQILFYSLYEQGASSVLLFISRNVDRSIFSVLGTEELMIMGQSVRSIPATTFLALDPIYNILLGSLLTKLWLHYPKLRPSISTNFIIGSMGLVLGFLILGSSQYLINEAGMLSAGWVAVIYFLFVIAEICSFPVGMSAITRLAPKQHSARYIGVWMLCTAGGVWVSGLLSQRTAILEPCGPDESLLIYCSAYWTLMVLAVLLMIITFASRPILRWGEK